MAGSFSSKKVSRVARTGRARRRNPNSASYTWYAAMAAICILGSFLVGFSRHERLDAKNPGSTAPLAPSPDRAGDFWYEAYGVYICDKFNDPIKNDNDPYGINTKADGVIHIHPFERKYAGRNSNLGRFAKAVDMKVDKDELKVPGNDKTFNSSEKCGDKDGEVVVKEWKDAKDANSGKKVDGDPKRLLLKDNAAVVVAFVPKDTKIEDIPLPPAAGDIEKVKNLEQNPPAQAAPEETAATTSTTTPPQG